MKESYIAINVYVENKLSKFIADFRKLNGTQHFMVTIIKNITETKEMKLLLLNMYGIKTARKKFGEYY